MLSVVVTNYNHGRFLPDALDGLLAQTRPADELIIIDDASTDDSTAVISPYLERFPQAQLVRNPVNLGCVANLNRAIDMVRGDIIHFAAADDVTYPRLFETGVALLTAHPQAALVSARTDLMAENGRVIGPLATPTPLKRDGFISPDAAAHMLMRDDGWFTGNTTLYRREALAAAGGFPDELGSFCDGYISRLLALRHGACFSPEVLGAWRRMEGGLAWSQTADLARAEQLIAIVARHMTEASDLFPAGYRQRWAGRYLFGARRLTLANTRRKALAAGAVGGSWALSRELFLTLWWFLALRPWDAAAVTRRRLGMLLRRA
jgi:glycosyltransferase involved in cell wall biosynthesis